MAQPHPTSQNLVADGTFSSDGVGQNSFYWRVCDGGPHLHCVTSPDRGLHVSSPKGGHFLIQNGTWGSRIFFEAGQSYVLKVSYRSPVDLRVTLASEGASDLRHGWTLPPSEERTAWETPLSSELLDSSFPHYLELGASLRPESDMEISQVSIVPLEAPDLPIIAVGIVTFNRRMEVCRLLDQVRSLHYPQDRLQVFVVDNASEDGTSEELTAKYPWVTVLRNPENLGGAGGFNRFFCHLLTVSDPPTLGWLIDDDAQIAPYTLIALLRALRAEPSAAIAGSVMMDLENPLVAYEAGGQLDPACFGWFPNLLHADLCELRQRTDQYQEVGYAGAYSLLFRAEILQDAGIWRDYFLHVDDSEWCYRVRAVTGKKVIIALDSLIWHVLQGSQKPFTTLRYYETRNFLNFSSSFRSRRALLRVFKQCIGMGLVQLFARRTDLFDFHMQGIESFFAGEYGRKDLRRAALSATTVSEVLKIYRERYRKEPSRIFIVTEINQYVGDGTDYESKFVDEVRSLLPGAEIVAVSIGEDSTHRLPVDDTLLIPSNEHPLRTRFGQLRTILSPSEGVVILPFWNQRIIPNNLARLTAVYESGAFSLYPSSRTRLVTKLAKLAFDLPRWVVRILSNRYDPEAAEVIPPSEDGQVA